MKNILDAIVAAGGRPLFVGGCVRDSLLGIEAKDIDVEVYGLSADELVSVLCRFGKVDQVGVSFGVIKLTTPTDDYDFTLPRTENKVGIGHKGFIVEVDHTLTPEQAAERRDYTINSVARDMDGNLIDPFNGKRDLENHILRATSDHFGEDPLRVMRGFQFCGRFDLIADGYTLLLCQSLLGEAHTIATERIYGEVLKWALKSTVPSMGLAFLWHSRWVSLFPELEILGFTEQEPEWHPEGDVYTHTALVCDAAVEIAVRDGLNDDDRLVLVLAALCHDLGKATCTIVDNGRIKSPGHDQAGKEPTISLLTRMGFGEKVINQVVPLVVEHMAHIGTEPTEKSVRRLACRVSPSNINQLVRLMEADHSGRPPLPKGCPESPRKILEISKRLEITDSKPKPILGGKHLIEYLNLIPGPHYKVILDKVYQAQLDGDVVNINQAVTMAEVICEELCEH
jgi:tRNA nucleotidyltransferase (CCA-adding enzyme)